MRLWSSSVGVVLWSAMGLAMAHAGEPGVASGTDVEAGIAADGSDRPIVDMDAMVVSGVQPGPGLWRVSGNQGHVLYILGTQSPLPRDMQWEAAEVRQVLAEADAILGAPGVSVSADVGLLRGLTLVPAALRAQRNSGGETLQELLPGDVHARWLRLKEQYLGRDRGVEKKRPPIAAHELYRAALKRHGLRMGDVVAPVISEAATARGLERVSTELAVKVEDPRKALADFRGEAMRPQDLECFVRTLDLVGRELPQVARRANAWATGDLAALRAMPQAGSQVLACLDAWTQTEAARKRGFADLEARMRAHWVEAAAGALEQHAVSFATLPIEALLHDRGGYVTGLVARGYVVEAPDHIGAVDDSAADPAHPSAPGAGQ